MKPKSLKTDLLGVLVLLCATTLPVYAAGEVVSVRGNAYVTGAERNHELLKQGDFIGVDDTVETPANGFVDIAYDKEWNNVSHLEGNTEATIRSVSPIELQLHNGAIFARLKSLRGSTFSVFTPVAVASARGTEFLTIHMGAQTTIFNFSNSTVELAAKNAAGRILKPAATVENGKKSSVPTLGQPPHNPVPMTKTEQEEGTQIKDELEKRLSELKSGNHTAWPVFNVIVIALAVIFSVGFIVIIYSITRPKKRP